ncbi:hypothetical protein GQ42DRAFT_178652 [Ramicandelaber brevisporus]|nr:hypothetical protein GQ42DRAFT_178652 [Ramicandelaber brevisporus]
MKIAATAALNVALLAGVASAWSFTCENYTKTACLKTIPNVSTAIIVLASDHFDSDLWLLEACRGWKRLKSLHLIGGYSEPDSDFANSLNQLLCFTPELHTLAFTDFGFENLGSVQLATAKLPQLTTLNVSLENLTTPSELVSFLEPLCNLVFLGLDEVNSLHMLDAVANIVEQANFAPKMKSFSVSTGMDLVKTPPVVIREEVEVDVKNGTGDEAATAEKRTITRARKVLARAPQAIRSTISTLRASVSFWLSLAPSAFQDSTQSRLHTTLRQCLASIGHLTHCFTTVHRSRGSVY